MKGSNSKKFSLIGQRLDKLLQASKVNKTKKKSVLARVSLCSQFGEN